MVSFVAITDDERKDAVVKKCFSPPGETQAPPSPSASASVCNSSLVPSTPKSPEARPLSPTRTTPQAAAPPPVKAMPVRRAVSATTPASSSFNSALAAQLAALQAQANQTSAILAFICAKMKVPVPDATATGEEILRKEGASAAASSRRDTWSGHPTQRAANAGMALPRTSLRPPHLLTSTVPRSSMPTLILKSFR